MSDFIHILAIAARISRNGLVVGNNMHLRMQDTAAANGMCHLWCPVCHIEHRQRLAQAFEAADEYRCACGARADSLIYSSIDPFESHLLCCSCGKVFLEATDTFDPETMARTQDLHQEASISF